MYIYLFIYLLVAYPRGGGAAALLWWSRGPKFAGMGWEIQIMIELSLVRTLSMHVT